MSERRSVSEVIDGAISRLETREYSCGAVYGQKTYSRALRGEALEFLESLGCPMHSRQAFNDIPVRRRRYARALWLTWAAMIAKDAEIEAGR
jgi:hypothetical protein